MKLSLIIATTNLHRKKVITSIIKETFPEIEIEKAKISKKTVSPETGKEAMTNVIEKAKYYGKFFNNNVLCEDDTIVVEGVEISPNREGKKILSKSDVFKNWEVFLKEKGSVKGKVVKAFALYTRKTLLKDKIETEIRLQLPKEKPNRISTNPLNYFIIPKGYSKPLSDFNNSELRLYRKKEFFLLKNLIITFELNK